MGTTGPCVFLLACVCVCVCWFDDVRVQWPYKQSSRLFTIPIDAQFADVNTNEQLETNQPTDQQTDRQTERQNDTFAVLQFHLRCANWFNLA